MRERGSREIPEATVARLAVYLRVLTGLVDATTTTMSSEELATIAGVNSAKLRKDLSYLGSVGTRGVGYDVIALRERIAEALGLAERRTCVLVGVGNLGHALAGYSGFSSRGFSFVGYFDVDPGRVGEPVADGAVADLADLEEVVTTNGVSIGVIATPAEGAQSVADRLVAAGVTGILNFAPAVLAVPANVDVRKIDLAAEMQILSFHEHRKSGAASTRVDLDSRGARRVSA